ncbi:hypothetical protein LJK87_32725 [Paenibacillus sp. P25]|nr:hypothetical protein LJK87_32725 [Paenibacillus sp. P25]
MMSKRNTLLLAGSVIVFIVLLYAAYRLESTEYLYTASALPILIVLFLPDISRNQYLDLTKKNSGVRLVKQTEGQVPLLFIDFEPGAIWWNCSKLYLDLNQLSQAGKAKPSAMSSASLSVLSFDLSNHPRKMGWVGIDLKQLAERTRSLSYTTDEVTRLVIRMSDLEETAMRMMTTAGTPASEKSKSLQA